MDDRFPKIDILEKDKPEIAEVIEDAPGKVRTILSRIGITKRDKSQSKKARNQAKASRRINRK